MPANPTVLDREADLSPSGRLPLWVQRWNPANRRPDGEALEEVLGREIRRAATPREESDRLQMSQAA